MKTYALICRQDEETAQIAQTLKEKLKDVLIYDQDNPDLVICVGGDGTVLEGVHQYMTKNCAFLGVHTGTLGFFTDYKKDELDQLIKDIQKNEYEMNDRHLLEVRAHHCNHQDSLYYALNEMRLDHGFHTQVLDISINDILLETFRGNGICISTPSGSTAYNKSLGGAVIYPGKPLMQLTEVAGIHHNAYRSLGSSLVLDENQTIKIKGTHFDYIVMGIDHHSHHLENVESIEIKVSSKVVRFIEYRKMSFIKRVRRAYIS